MISKFKLFVKIETNYAYLTTIQSIQTICMNPIKDGTITTSIVTHILET
jgi:hypothetical protein